MLTFEPGIWDSLDVFRSYMPLVERGLVTVDRCRFELTDEGRAFLREIAGSTQPGTRERRELVAQLGREPPYSDI